MLGFPGNAGISWECWDFWDFLEILGTLVEFQTGLVREGAEIPKNPENSRNWGFLGAPKIWDFWDFPRLRMSQKFGILGVPKAQRIPKFWDLWVFLNPQKIPKIENPKSSKNPTDFTFLGRKKSQKFELLEPLEKSQKSLNPFKLRIPNPGCGEGSKIWEFFSGMF